MTRTRLVSLMAAVVMLVSLAGPQALAAAEGKSASEKGKPEWVVQKQEPRNAGAEEQPPGAEQDAGDAAGGGGSEPTRGNQGQGQLKEKGSPEPPEGAAGEAESSGGNQGRGQLMDKGKPDREATDEEESAETADDEAAADPTDVAKAKWEQRIQELREMSLERARAERAQGEPGPYLVYVNGERLNLTPLARGGRTLVPFRNLSEYLGATVGWEPSTRTVTMARDDVTVQLTIGSTMALVTTPEGTVEVELDVAPEIVNDLTFAPVRFIAQIFGAYIEYDPETGAITLITLDEDETTDEDESTGAVEATDEGESTGAVEATDEGESTGADEASDEGESTGADETTDEDESTGAVEATDEGESTGAVEATDEGESPGADETTDEDESTGAIEASDEDESPGDN